MRRGRGCEGDHRGAAAKRPGLRFVTCEGSCRSDSSGAATAAAVHHTHRVGGRIINDSRTRRDAARHKTARAAPRAAILQHHGSAGGGIGIIHRDIAIHSQSSVVGKPAGGGRRILQRAPAERKGADSF